MFRRGPVLLLISLVLTLGLTSPAFGVTRDDALPGIPVGVGTIAGVVDAATDLQDYYAVQLFDGSQVAIRAHLTANPSDFLIMSLVDDSGTEVASDWTNGLTAADDAVIVYSPAAAGVYSIKVRPWSSTSNGVAYSLTVSGNAAKPSNATVWGVGAAPGYSLAAVYGASTYVRGVLTPTFCALALQQSVATFQESTNTTTWSTVSSAASASGVFISSVTVAEGRFYRWVFDGDGVYAASISPSVKVVPLPFTVLADAGTGGAIAPTGAQSVPFGTNKTFAIIPSTGYHISDVLVDGVSVGEVPSYTFTHFEANHTISASFDIDTFEIVPTTGPGGSIAPSDRQTINYGASQTFAVSPASGYYVADVLVDGISVGPVSSYEFQAVSASHTISTVFEPQHPTSVVLSARSNASLGYGSTFPITGSVTSGGIGLPAAQVVVQSRAPGAAFKDTGLGATTGAEGFFSISAKPTTKTEYRVRFAGLTTYSASQSAAWVYATPKPDVRTPIAPKTMSHSKSYTVHGYLKPRHTSGSYPVRIYKYRKVSGHYRSYGYVKAKASNYYSYTKYSVKVKLTKTGKWRLRAYAPADSGHAAKWSGYDYVTVK